MTGAHDSERVTVELYVRSLGPRAGIDRQERAVERLDALAAKGALAAFSVSVWGRRVSLSTTTARTDAGQSVLERVDAFRAWAEDAGRSVESFFETQRVTSELADREYAALVLPALTLSEYRDGDLAFVAPSSDGGSVCTVADRIDHLAADLSASEDGAADAARPEAEEEPGAVARGPARGAGTLTR
ncbi:MAG: HTH domain-containing protein [Haloarculaceae archaeon]